FPSPCRKAGPAQTGESKIGTSRICLILFARTMSRFTQAPMNSSTVGAIFKPATDMYSRNIGLNSASRPSTIGSNKRAFIGPKKNHHNSIACSSPFSGNGSTWNFSESKPAALSTAFFVSEVTTPNASDSNIPTRIPRSSPSPKDRASIADESASSASGPFITSNNARTSATVRAIGPTTPNHANAPAPRGKCPVPGIRPGVGFNPLTPQKCAGTRTDPPPSLPTPPIEQPDAIAAASPPLDPPADRESSHGLLVFPNNALSVSYAIKNSGTLVFPIKIAPAALSRDTSTASSHAT